MAESKQIKATDVIAAPKQKPIIMAQYKPLPRFGAGCTNCR